MVRALVLSVLLVAGAIDRGAAQSSCLTAADTAGIIRQKVEDVVTLADSAKLATQGLPYRPSAGVVLVTSTPVCSKVVSAYNGLLPIGDPRRITRAYVYKVGQSAYAGVGEKTTVDLLHITFFNSKYKWLAAMTAMN